MEDFKRLKGTVRKEIDQLHKAEQERGQLMRYTIYIGTLGLLIIIPVVGGAYLGVWLDRQLDTYIWTAALIAVGVLVGVLNVYLYLRE